MAEAALSQPEQLPVGPIRRHGVGWWGAGTLIASEAALFAYLLFSYYYLGATNPTGWLLEPAPSLKLPLPNTLLLLASSGAAWFGERGILTLNRAQALAGFGLAFLMGTGFAAVQVLEWRGKSYGIGLSSYSSLYFVTTGFHMAHVLVGLLVLAALVLWTALDYFSPRPIRTWALIERRGATCCRHCKASSPCLAVPWRGFCS
jgi:heme/copper-type cytochrome/quinol oxidase subunit 3